jgi:hypothetical protein
MRKVFNPKIFILSLILIIFSCEKYYPEDLQVLDELSVVALEYHNDDMSKDDILAFFEDKGYKCYFNDNYDEYYLKNLISKRSIVYEKSKYLTDGEILNKTILVSENSKIFKVSITVDTTKEGDSSLRTSTSLIDIQVFDLQKYDMSKYDSPFDIGK